MFVFFCGSYFDFNVKDNGEIELPENFVEYLKPGAEYHVVYWQKEWDKGLTYLSYTFDMSVFDGAVCIESGVVPEDKVLKIPEAYIDIMKGPVTIIGNICAIEISKVPIEMLCEGAPDPNVLNIDLLK